MSWDFGWRGAGLSRCDLPKMYEKYCLPYAKKIVRALESDDFFVSYHICGNTTRIFDHMVSTGAGILEFDYKCDKSVVKKAAAGTTTLLGPIDPSGVMHQGSVEDVETACREAIEILAPGGGFILGPGCALPAPHLRGISKCWWSARKLTANTDACGRRSIWLSAPPSLWSVPDPVRSCRRERCRRLESASSRLWFVEDRQELCVYGYLYFPGLAGLEGHAAPSDQPLGWLAALAAERHRPVRSRRQPCCRYSLLES